MKDQKDDLLKKTLEDLGKIYPIGLYEYLYKHCEQLYKKLIAIEDTLDRAFISDRVGILIYKAILRDYWTLHIKAIYEFKKVDQLDFNLPVVRREMEEERIRA